MTDQRDLLCTPRTRIFDFGDRDRIQRLVIRIRTLGTNLSSKATSQTLPQLQRAPDTSGAGCAWSQSELLCDGVPPVELVVVVGRLINGDKAKHALPDSLALPTKSDSPLVFHGTPLVVCRLTNINKAGFYILRDKKEEDGLCSIAQLPSSTH
jgi:hypothetical protein